jgi:hypothetical protein
VLQVCFNSKQEVSTARAPYETRLDTNPVTVFLANLLCRRFASTPIRRRSTGRALAYVARLDTHPATAATATVLFVVSQVRLNAKQEKKYRARLAPGAATSGLSSTLAFTPVQVRRCWCSSLGVNQLSGGLYWQQFEGSSYATTWAFE